MFQTPTWMRFGSYNEIGIPPVEKTDQRHETEGPYRVKIR
jgi:hypothetical protein